MNFLTDKLPTVLMVDGENYEIHSDFRTWIKLTQDFFLKEITASSIAKAICLVYKQIPPNPESAVLELFNFYTVAKNKQNETASRRQGNNVFDFDMDAPLIFASFFQQYGIDLTKTDMHWWLFKSLFDALSAETAFGKALHFRSVDITQIKDKEQQKYYLKMKRVYSLPDKRSEREKEKDIAENLFALF
jgi:hypothetical protein